MNAFRRWLQMVVQVLPLAVLTAALIVILNPPRSPHRPEMDWLVWTALTVPILTSGAGGCHWVLRKPGTPGRTTTH